MNVLHPSLEEEWPSTDGLGRYRLEALHEASGKAMTRSPKNWLLLAETQQLLAAFGSSGHELAGNSEPVFVSFRGKERQGTFAIPAVLLAYALWLSPGMYARLYSRLGTDVCADPDGNQRTDTRPQSDGEGENLLAEELRELMRLD